MLPPPPRPRYHFTRQRGPVPKRLYYHFTAWLTHAVGGQLIIDGVDSVKNPRSLSLKQTTPAAEDTPASGGQLKSKATAPVAPYRVPHQRGLMSHPEHLTFANWLEKNHPPKQPLIDQVAED